ncbi:M24 family metallopeptidase [Gorillibacterium massiliense]|uniref:M24 family metallopeptidase n=1 Tax=Gorillibacterium massiliense TaxID=1280390 RepID=UPI0004B9DCC4|nr:Xaa-Pro peptidase family protein [Gorillibacterium massiliense]
MGQTRLDKLRVKLAESGLDALFVTNPFNRRYLTGFTGTSGYVLITADEAWFLTDFRYTEQAAEQVRDFSIVMHKPAVIETVKELLDAAKIKRLAFEQGDLIYGTYLDYSAKLGDITLIPTSNLVEGLRDIKDEEEIAVLEEAADLADKTFTHILGYLKPGITEWDVALEMEMFMRKNGAASSSFDTIIASGERSALPHGVASSRVLHGDEFVTMDYGALYKGYCSDITRTVVLGKATEKHREIYKIVLEAQLTCLAGLKPGMTGQEGDALARDVIAKAGYGDRFGHGTGHGIGLEIHENPRLGKLSDTVLKPGMVVTVEPGIYLPGFGGVRIEDDVVVTETGIRVITKSTKELLEI